MEELKKTLGQAKALWGKLPRSRRFILVGALVATVVGLVVMTSKGAEKYGVLFSGLSAEDAGGVVEALKAAKVPYQVNGTAVEVPEAKVHELRLSLAQKGLPRGGGVGFEVFDKQTFGTTSFVEQLNYRRALQGELARTISSLEEVDTARVHIAIPERSIYTSSDETPSASVALRLRAGRALAPGQVRGISHLVASSVDRLAPERVTVLDEKGNVLSGGEDSGGQLDSQQALEHTLALRVKDVVGRLVGAGKVAVVVTAELDFARTDRTEESYDKDNTALRSESRTEERAAGGTGGSGSGVAGARGNLPGAPAASGGVANDPGLMRLTETRNFEVNRVVSRIVGPSMKVKQLHVAVLVDQPAAGPRGAEELARISALAREAAGLSKERGDSLEVHSAPFASEPGDLDEKPVVAAPMLRWPPPVELIAAAGGGVLLLLVAAVALIVMRRKTRRLAKARVLPSLPASVGAVEAALPGAAAAAGAPGLPAPSARERALLAARNDAARAARVLSAWMGEAVANGGQS